MVEGAAAVESDMPPIPGGDGLRGRHIGQAVVIVGPCGQRHTMSVAAGRALAKWLEQHCTPARDAEFTTIDGSR